MSTRYSPTSMSDLLSPQNSDKTQLKTTSLRRISKRFACDRCHAHKLRCPRQGDSEGPCSRCSKAGVACFYSASLRKGKPIDGSIRSDYRSSEPRTCNRRPHGNTKELTQKASENLDAPLPQSHDGDAPAHGYVEDQQFTLGEDIDWLSWMPVNFEALPSFNINQGLDNEPARASAAYDPLQTLISGSAEVVDAVDSQPSTSNTEISLEIPPKCASLPHDTQIGSMEECIHQLSNLHILLYHCSQRVNSILSHMVPYPMPVQTSQTSSVASLGNSTCSNHPSSTDLESIFSASNKLVDIVTCLTRKVAAQTPSDLPHSAPYGSSQSVTQAQFSPASTSSSFLNGFSDFETDALSGPPDSATVLLVLSCYLRFLHTYSHLVERLEQRFRERLPIQLPGLLLVMSLSPSSSDLQVVILLQLIFHLLNRASKAIGEFASGSDADGLSVREVHSREWDLREKLTRVRAALNCSSFL
jgi:hypothetical protein